jgi:hypothetical protein
VERLILINVEESEDWRSGRDIIIIYTSQGQLTMELTGLDTSKIYFFTKKKSTKNITSFMSFHPFP